ncbi:Serine-protein kinase ATM, partial [Ophiophagus hannah]
MIFSCWRCLERNPSSTIFDDSFWLELSYLQVAMVAQSCSAHFTALLYAEIYADKIGRQQERIRTYEHEGLWGKALVTYDLQTSLPPSIRQAGLVEALQNYGLCNTLSIYLKGLEQQNEESSVELQEICYQAAWRNMQWDQISSVKDEVEQRGYHESLYDALQCLRDRDFSTFYGRLKCARIKEVEELLKGSLESVYSLLPTLCRLQTIGELEYVGQLFSRSETNSQLHNLHLKWQKQSQLLQDSDFAFQEPIMALRTVILKLLLEKENENAQRECITNILTEHLVELSRLARMANNSQLPERAIYEVKQYSLTRQGVSEWKLEEAQVFWAKKEESLALSILKDMIKKLDENWFEVEKDPHLKLIYTECLRLCGSWLAETFLENPTIIMQNYLEKAVKIAGDHNDDSSDELKRGKMKAFLSLARFSDTEYQRIEDRMKSSEFENKQALLKKAKYEVDLLKEHKVQNNRYTVKVQRELQLDECEIRALGEDRKRFLCKAVENYIMCLLSGEEHDMWIFRLCSLWLENAGLSEDRMEAASNIINIVKDKRPDMVVKVEVLCDAYITLANMDATPWKTHRRGINIPSDQPLIKLKNLEDVAVPTMEIKVDPSGKYENLITIRSFKPEFRLAGGVNLPKIIDCIGSDGQQRRQLVKVVPLSQRSGILEWCTGTIPLGEFLINTDSSAHKRYRPQDYTSLDCQKKMVDAQKNSFEEKYTIFMDICQNFQPVFRYFCMERFLDPAVWFEKRLAYTRSIATSSIVGYILGLGDRHVQNILLDEESAELVHIDLGVAFEQGKILPTPETVPFRLTRDIVDGMGIAGVEGVFRRCCEKTMNVMRNSQEALLTIVEVLLYDPLFDWTMNPLKALYLQQRSEDEADVSSNFSSPDQGSNKKANGENQLFNKVAERVLIRLQEKLKGMEEGTVLSVAGQVNFLIQQAMDPKNLSRLFPGWKPWV